MNLEAVKCCSTKPPQCPATNCDWELVLKRSRLTTIRSDMHMEGAAALDSVGVTLKRFNAAASSGRTVPALAFIHLSPARA